MSARGFLFRVRHRLGFNPFYRAAKRFFVQPLEAALEKRLNREMRAPVPDAAPPVRAAQSLPGTLWAITSYFNPAGFDSRKHNLTLFRERLKAQGVPLLAVELAFGDQPELVEGVDADIVVTVPRGDVMWQKERLLNLALAHLPAECDKVAWLDSDVLFERDDWAVRTARLLKDYRVVQPFSYCVDLRQGAGENRAQTDGRLNGHEYYGVARGMARHGHSAMASHRRRGHTGFAWAARRSVLDGLGLFDLAIAGSGDELMAAAFFSGEAHLPFNRMSPRLAARLREWARRMHARVAGSVGYQEGRVYHQWHGSLTDRAYGQRDLVLLEYDFDPAADLVLNEFGAWEWSSDKPALHAWLKQYFEQRFED